jgi:DNA-binding transcriptional ArsR family regulator
MKLIQIYQCFCDPTRLRILNLLGGGELCVCHFQKVLGEPQVKVSKHLAYLRMRGLVDCRKEANWMIYRLPSRPTPELAANLACLQDCARENPIFHSDTRRLHKLQQELDRRGPACCRPTRGAEAPARRTNR